MTGYPDDNPKTAFGLKKVPLHLVPPIAVAQIALAFENGASKYGPFNWREKTISSTVYYGAALRHLMAWFDGEDLAPDSGVHHLAHVMACCAMVLDGEGIGKLNDNRPPKGGLPTFLESFGKEKKIDSPKEENVGAQGAVGPADQGLAGVLAHFLQPGDIGPVKRSY